MRYAKSEKLCGCIAFCGRNADFEYLRQGMILGLFDYFVSPFKKIQFYSAFERIRNRISEYKKTESDLKQKTIAAELYINSSYLSTVFSAQTQLRFVDYITTVKLKRAGWLVQNTTMKIIEIAARLDYKDVGYFSKVFKKQYKVTPTEYRLPDDYTYQI